MLPGAFLSAAPARGNDYQFSDKPLKEGIELPNWFKLSFLELYDDLDDVKQSGKRGLILYFGQPDCPYCKAQIENSWGRSDISTYTRKYFEVVALNVRGERLVTTIDGGVMTEKAFSTSIKANFTPTLLFYDLDGKVALRLSGYHPPYQFQAALEFVADGHYLRESFRDYLARAEAAVAHGSDELNQHPIFSRPPYAFDRTRFKSNMPLAVFFEQNHCHACDVLHAGPLQERAIIKKLKTMEVVQLDMWADTPLITTLGQRRMARDWANELGIYYSPTIVFFDGQGKEIIRVDSIIHFYRLNNVLEYISTRGYLKYPNFQRWRREYKKEK